MMVRYLTLFIFAVILFSCKGNISSDQRIKVTGKSAFESFEAYFDGRTDIPAYQRNYAACYGKAGGEFFIAGKPMFIAKPIQRDEFGALLIEDIISYHTKNEYKYDKNGYLDSMISIHTYDGSTKKDISIYTHEKGKLNSIITISSDGNKDTVFCFYNDKGYICKETFSFESENDSVVYRQDNEGRLKEVNYYKNGSADGHWDKFTYNGDKMTGWEIKDRNILQTSERIYDNGKLSKILSKDSTGAVNYQFLFYYDSKNNCIRHKEVNVDGGGPEYKYSVEVI